MLSFETFIDQTQLVVFEKTVFWIPKRVTEFANVAFLACQNFNARNTTSDFTIVQHVESWEVSIQIVKEENQTVASGTNELFERSIGLRNEMLQLKDLEFVIVSFWQTREK